MGAEGGRQKILTEEQIRLADEHADKQAKLRTEISLHAQAIAADMLPALNNFKQTIVDIAKDQQFAATASDILKGALSAAITIFQTIAVVGSDVAFVFKGIGNEIGAIGAQLVALSTGNLEGFHAISDAVKEDAQRARVELDRFQAKIMSLGQATAPFVPDPANYGNEGRGVPAPKKKASSSMAGRARKRAKDTYTDLLTPAAGNTHPPLKRSIRRKSPPTNPRARSTAHKPSSTS